jgi:hypothetical protein
MLDLVAFQAAGAPKGFDQGDLITISGLIGNGSGERANFTVTGGASETPSATLSVERAFTTKGTTKELSAFKPGDTIWYVVSMHVDNGPARATVRWKVTGPRKLYDYKSDETSVNSGSQAPYAPAVIPRDAPSGTYTLTAIVTSGGKTTTRTSRFHGK